MEDKIEKIEKQAGCSKAMSERKCGIYQTLPKTERDLDGGLRTKGIFKTDSEDYPLITYITVVYNRVNTLLACMQSVWSQDYPNIEYIIIDGASTDGTVELIEKNADKIDYYISQPDTGIYNAMNKGVLLASGRFICFMNSDDQCMPGAAGKVAELFRETKADIICGSRELTQGGERVYEVKYPRYCVPKSVFRYVQMFHQSTYVRPEVFDTVGFFEEQYSLLADWIWESGSIDAGFHICFTDEELAKFSYDGASCQGIYKRDKEWEEWVQKSFPKLKKKDARFFIYCLDRGRHPLFDLKMLNKVAVQYFDDRDFRRTYYATVLLACMEQCTDIKLMGKGRETYIEKKLKRFKLEEKLNIHDFYTLVKWLDEKLMEVCHNNADVSWKDVEQLTGVRKYLNQIFYHLYITRAQKEDASKLDRMLRVMCYTMSKCVSKNIFFSRRFYTALRAVWYYSFKGKFVES